MYAKIIDGRVVELSDDEPTLGPFECCLVVEVGGDVQVGWRWSPLGCTAPGPDEALLAEIAELEAMQTPRLLREAVMNKDCVVSKPGCCIDGMTPAQALEAIETRVAELRGQLSAVQYYQK